MNVISNIPRKTILYGAALAATALMIVLLSASYAASPTMAQTPPGGGGTPQLCGPGQDHFPKDPDEVVSEGHYALFDAYWQPADGIRPGALNDNLCPPAAAHTDVPDGSGQTTEVTTRSPSKIDVRTTIIQVNDTHKVDVVRTNAEAGKTKLSLEKYKGVRAALGLGRDDAVKPGTKVHWLRLEDPDLGVDPSSLVLGFSTGLLDEAHWQNPETDEDGNHLPAFEYELESVRVIGPNPATLPHVFTYWEPELGSGLVWDSSDVDTNVMPLGAGEYEHLEWVFTKPGTYIVQVHLKGHVRQTKPSDWNDNGQKGTWKKLTEDKTVTSEVKRYVFQVGDLHLNAQPHFGYHRTVDRLARYGDKVGDPIPVYGVDIDRLHYELVGEGSDRFRVVPAPSTFLDNGVQLEVAGYANLYNLEKPTQFDLQLRVRDRRDIENHRDNVIDDVVPVRVTVTTTDPWVSLKFLNENPRVGDYVNVLAEIRNGDPGIHHYRLYTIGDGGAKTLLQESRTNVMTHEFTITRATAGSVVYYLEAWHGEHGPKYPSPQYHIAWRR